MNKRPRETFHLRVRRLEEERLYSRPKRKVPLREVVIAKSSPSPKKVAPKVKVPALVVLTPTPNKSVAKPRDSQTPPPAPVLPPSLLVSMRQWLSQPLLEIRRAA
jgi:hypothetical protein